MTTDRATTYASGYCSAHQEPCLQCYAGLKSRLQATEDELGILRELEHMVRTDGAIPRRLLSEPLRKLEALRAAPPSPPVTEWIEEAEAAMDRFLKEPRSASEIALYDAIRWVLAGVRDELRTKRS